MLKQLAQELVDSYSKFDDTKKICSFIMFGVHVHKTFAYVCHTPLNYPGGTGYRTLITSFPVKDVSDLKFFDFMRTVLYHKYSNHIHLEELGGQYYIRISDLNNIPANVLMNICICSRIIVEHRPQLAVWQELVTKGLHPSIALAVCRSTAGSDMDMEVTDIGINTQHWPIDSTVNLITLMSGNLNSNVRSINKCPYGCTPTNCIWGNTRDLKGLEGSTINAFWEKWKNRVNAEIILQPS